MRITVSPKQFNEKLGYFKEHHIRIICRGKGYKASRKRYATCDLQDVFIEEDRTKVEMTYKEPGCPHADTMICYLDGDEHSQEFNVAAAVREFYSYYKPPKIPTSVGTAIPLLGNCERYDGTRNYAVEYDLNSAYSSSLVQDLPQTEVNLGPKIVEEGEMGFNSWIRTFDSQTVLELAKVGEYGRYVFKTMPSPWTPYVDKYYGKKQNSTGEERARAKSYLNVVIGNLQNQNPFMRAAIVCRCNEYIKGLLDEDSIYWNTDAIVSLKRRPDIEANLGDELGQWKIDNEGEFAFKGLNFQWNHDTPGQRGVPKVYFEQWKKHNPDRDWFDLLRDGVPPSCNKFLFDWDKGEVIENEQYV